MVLDTYMYDWILVPTDGSSASQRAAGHAVDLAGIHHAGIHALYVVHTESYAGFTMEASWEGIGEMLYEEGEVAVAEVAALADDAGLSCEQVIREGTPSREIVRYAEEAGCDLIVMGTHGRGGLDRLLLGSVAERVVRTATVPVLTIRARDEGDGS